MKATVINPPRAFTREEIEKRHSDRLGASKPAARDPGTIKRRNRKRTRNRHSVTLSPRTSLFLRMQYGGPNHELSSGIETAAKILYRLSIEALSSTNEFNGILPLSKRQRELLENAEKSHKPFDSREIP